MPRGLAGSGTLTGRAAGSPAASTVTAKRVCTPASSSPVTLSYISDSTSSAPGCAATTPQSTRSGVADRDSRRKRTCWLRMLRATSAGAVSVICDTMMARAWFTLWA